MPVNRWILLQVLDLGDVEQVFETPAAGRIEGAITLVDKQVKGKGTVRLLTIPAFYTHALLVIRLDDT